jgi:predicted O-methyltransferase YrrM
MNAAARALTIRVLPTGWVSRLSWLRRYGVRNLPAHVSREIPGFLQDEEAVALFQIARNLPPGSTVVELGSWLGKTSVVIAKGLQRGSGSRLYCIDPFAPAGDARSVVRYRELAGALGGGLRDAFLANLDRHDVADRVSVLQGFSHEFSGDWEDEIDCLFIDADHSYEAVARDLEEWSGFVRPGGWLLLHDVWLEPPAGTSVYHQGPARVVRERILGNAEWVEPRTAGSLFQARRRALGGGTLGRPPRRDSSRRFADDARRHDQTQHLTDHQKSEAP